MALSANEKGLRREYLSGLDIPQILDFIDLGETAQRTFLLELAPVKLAQADEIIANRQAEIVELKNKKDTIYAIDSVDK